MNPGMNATAATATQSDASGVSAPCPNNSAAGVTTSAAAIITDAMYSIAGVESRERREKNQYAVHVAIPTNAARSPSALHDGDPDEPMATIATPTNESPASARSRAPTGSASTRADTSAITTGDRAEMIVASATLVSLNATNASEISTPKMTPPGAQVRNVLHVRRRRVKSRTTA